MGPGSPGDRRRQGRFREDGRRIPGDFGADLDQRLTVRDSGKGGRAFRFGGHDSAERGGERRSDQAVSADDSRWAGYYRRSFGGPHQHRRTVRRQGPGDTAIAAQDFRLPAGERRATNCRARAISFPHWRAALTGSRSRTAIWNRCSASTSAGEIRKAVLTRESSRRCSSFWPARSFSSASSRSAPTFAGGRVVSRGRPGAGIPPVVLPVEQHSRRPIAESGHARRN